MKAVSPENTDRFPSKAGVLASRPLRTGRGICILMILVLIPLMSCNKQPSPPLSPEDALGSFVLADEQLEVQLVASEPLIQDPVAIRFDEGGRLWVVEMLGFMTDIEGTGELDPTGRVSVLFDDDQDGRMDRSVIFLDSLVLPRAVAIVKGGVLVAENIPLWFASDTDGDFKADSRTLIDSTYGGQGMPEHSANGLWRGMDNWLYNAKSKYRYKAIDGEWVRDETEFRGQWGIGHDNMGRLFYNYNWSQLHADLVPPNTMQNNPHHTPSSGIDHGLTLERKIFPIRSNTAVNRGYVPGTLDDQGRLLEFASACGPLIYRGDALPKSYSGDAFVCEPTANLIRQNNVINEGFMIRAEGVYADKEFLASSDERFRPISLASGPDGALYVVDMYKGIIQHGPYMTSYLREVTLDRHLEKPIHMGRIWRVTTKGDTRQESPDLEHADAQELTGLLGHPNGWTRDMAQRLLVDLRDPGSILGIAEQVASGNSLGKLHALWALEGLAYAEPAAYLAAMNDKDPAVSQAAIQRLVVLSRENGGIIRELEQFVKESFDDADPIVQMQMVLAAKDFSPETAMPIAEKFLTAYGHLPVARDVVLSSLEDRESTLLFRLLSRPEWRKYDQTREIILEMLASSIVNKGSLDEIRELFMQLGQIKDNSTKWINTALANGILNSKPEKDGSPLKLNEMPAIFKSESALAAGDSDLLSALKRRFTWPGKPVETRIQKNNRAMIDPQIMTSGRQKFLNLCASCHGTQGEGLSRFAPPLQDSEWVMGEDHKLAMLLLHGMEGPVRVNGKDYGKPDILPEMPSFSNMQNEDIAAIATYIRNSWGNEAPAVSAGRVGQIRFRTQGKITPWTQAELDTVTFKGN